MNRALLLAVMSAIPIEGRIAIKPVSTVPCSNLIPHELVVDYEVHGGTFAGLYDLHLSVYADGEARLASTSAVEGSKAEVAFVDPEAVAALAMDLSRGGAFVACDESGQVMDVPLSSLTILSGTTDGRSHSFSWWLPGAKLPIERRLQQFVTDVFPAF